MTRNKPNSNKALPPIFVLHVSKGYEERAEHIRKMMKRLGLDFEFILRGDIADLTPEVMDSLFAPEGVMAHQPSAISCAYKHLLACKEIVDRNLEGAIVLEDDIILDSNFEEVARQAIDEMPDDPGIISFEETILRYVPRSKREKGRVLYLGNRDRYTGALYINRRGAEAIYNSALSDRLTMPIDLYHSRLLHNGTIKYWWTHPTVAKQGSFNGLFQSSITIDRSKALRWRILRLYRKVLYFFR